MGLNQARKNMEFLLYALTRDTGRPNGMRMSMVYAGLKHIAWSVDDDCPKDVIRAANLIKQSTLAIQQQLKSARGFGTLQANAIRPQYKTLVLQGHDLCELLLPGEVWLYDKQFLGI